MGTPHDIYPESGSRLPAIKREDLDEEGKRQYDMLLTHTGGRSVAGLKGPGALNLYSPRAAAHLHGLSHYLRYECGMSPRIRELAILVTARELAQPFEWAAHEPLAMKVGVPAEVIDVIKHRRTTERLAETDAVVIELGRQVFGARKVSSECFARARRSFKDRELVEVVMLMGNYSAIAAMLTVFDVQIPAGQTPAFTSSHE